MSGSLYAATPATGGAIGQLDGGGFEIHVSLPDWSGNCRDYVSLSSTDVSAVRVIPRRPGLEQRAAAEAAALVRGEEELIREKSRHLPRGNFSSFRLAVQEPFSIGTSTRLPHSVHEPS